MVTVSLPVPEVIEPNAPDPGLNQVVLVPPPRLRLPLREPVELMIAESLPLPRFTDSTPLKAKPLRLNVPAFAPVTYSC